MRMQLMVEALAQAIEKAGSAARLAAGEGLDVVAIARALETVIGQSAGPGRADARRRTTSSSSRWSSGVMDRVGTPGVKFDVEGSGYGFRVVKTIAAAAAEQPTSCKMQRP